MMDFLVDSQSFELYFFFFKHLSLYSTHTARKVSTYIFRKSHTSSMPLRAEYAANKNLDWSGHIALKYYSHMMIGSTNCFLLNNQHSLCHRIPKMLQFI